MALLVPDDLWLEIELLLPPSGQSPEAAAASAGSPGPSRDPVRVAHGHPVARGARRTGLLRQDVLAQARRVARRGDLDPAVSCAAGAAK